MKEKLELVVGVLSPFVVDSIERWLSSFSGVPCSRVSDRAAQVCNHTITSLPRYRDTARFLGRTEGMAMRIRERTWLLAARKSADALHNLAVSDLVVPRRN